MKLNLLLLTLLLLPITCTAQMAVPHYVFAQVDLDSNPQNGYVDLVIGGTDAGTAAGARSNLGLEIGADVQAQNAMLDSLSALTDPNTRIIMFWDDALNELGWLTVGENLSIDTSTNTLNATGGTGTGSQTPWASNIDTADFELVNTTGTDGHITAGDDIIVDKIGETEDAIMSTNADDGEFSGFKTLKGGNVRWSFGASTTAESGSDAGSNFFIGSVDDAGVYQGAAMEITRATHAVEFAEHVIFPTYLELDEQSTDPGDPASGKGWLYLDDSVPSRLIFEDDSAGDHVVMTGVHNDTTPQLGGNLDVSTYELQSDGNVIIQLGDNAGNYGLILQDSDGNCVWAVDSNGTNGCP